MPRFNINGVWYDAPNYAAARAQSLAAHPAPPVVAPVAPAIVTMITPVVAPVANFLGRSTTRFGVGERITLGFTTTPPGRTAASFGGLTWIVASGAATVANDPGNVGTGTLTCGTKEGAVVLELRTTTAPIATKATKRLQVVRPNDVVFARMAGSGVYHRQGVASAGFRAITYLRPTDVSFSNLEYREGGASYTGSGVFGRDKATLSQLATSYDVIHPVRADWGPVNGGDSVANGSLVGGSDNMRTGPVPQIGVGEFRWSIPQYGRVIGTHDDFVIKSLDHVESCDAAGNMTISKGGVTVVCQLNDPSSDP